MAGRHGFTLEIVWGGDTEDDGSSATELNIWVDVIVVTEIKYRIKYKYDKKCYLTVIVTMDNSHCVWKSKLDRYEKI